MRVCVFVCGRVCNRARFNLRVSFVFVFLCVHARTYLHAHVRARAFVCVCVCMPVSCMLRNMAALLCLCAILLIRVWYVCPSFGELVVRVCQMKPGFFFTVIAMTTNTRSSHISISALFDATNSPLARAWCFACTSLMLSGTAPLTESVADLTVTISRVAHGHIRFYQVCSLRVSFP